MNVHTIDFYESCSELLFIVFKSMLFCHRKQRVKNVEEAKLGLPPGTSYRLAAEFNFRLSIEISFSFSYMLPPSSRLVLHHSTHPAFLLCPFLLQVPAVLRISQFPCLKNRETYTIMTSPRHIQPLSSFFSFPIECSPISSGLPFS